MAKDIGLFSIAFLPFLAVSLCYNYYRFGSIFETGYSLLAERTGLDFFTGTSLLTGLSGFLISPGKGFFYYSPVAILFFFSIRPFFKKHPELAVCFICIMISYLLFLSKNIYWDGEWAWGLRYLLALTPFFIMPIAEFFEYSIRMKKRFIRMIVYSIFTLSFIIQIAAVSVNFKKYFETLWLIEKVDFTIASGYGVQPIFEPPAETYFDSHRSHIMAQFHFIHDMTGKIKYYKFHEVQEDAPIHEKLKAAPYMNVFDFWWLYEYYVEGGYSGFLTALILFLTAIYSATRLLKTVTRDS
jgi:hypothetical protein